MNKLFNDFSGRSYSEWKEKISEDLKGKGFNKFLVSTSENIEILVKN